MLMEPAQTRFDLKWTLFRIPARVHPLFWLSALLLGFRADSAIELAIWMACLFFSIVVHEYGHALAAKRFGARGTRIWLYGLGGLAISEGGLTRRQRIIELLWGPGAGFVLCGLVLLGYGLGFGFDVSLAGAFGPFFESVAYSEAYGLAWDRMGEWPLRTLQMLVWINLVWGLVNLFPIFPLDGGQIARELYVARRGERGIEDSLKLAFRVCIVLIAVCLILALRTRLNEQKPDLFPALFFGLLAFLNHKLATPMYLEAQREQQRGLNAPRQPWEQDPDWWKGKG